MCIYSNVWLFLINCDYVFLLYASSVLHTAYEANVRAKNYLILLFQKQFIPIIKKYHTNATIIDHINRNHFLDKDIHSGIITADISDRSHNFLIFFMALYNEVFPKQKINIKQRNFTQSLDD